MPRNSPEKKVERACRLSVLSLGGEVDSFSQPRNTMQTPGIPDFRAVFPKLKERIWVEVKAGKNKPTLQQRAWLERELEMGGKAVVVYSDGDLLWALVEYGLLDLDMQGFEPHPETRRWVDLWRFSGVDEGSWADELGEEVGL